MFAPLRLALLGGIAALALGLWLYVGHITHQRDKALHERDTARVEATVAKGQATLNQSASEAVQAAQSREVAITVTAKEAAHAAAQAPGANEAVPPAVLAVWGAGIDRLRLESAASHLGAADPGGAGSAGAVPPATSPDQP